LENERIQRKSFLMGNVIIEDQWQKPRTRWENTPKDTSQILEYEDGGDNQKAEKNGASSEDGHGPEWALAPQIEWNVIS
jgi:hypothetical protein